MSNVHTPLFFFLFASLAVFHGGAAAQDALPPKTPLVVETLFTPLVIAPPRTSITPDSPPSVGGITGVAVGTDVTGSAVGRDPFEVSPRLRESRSRNRASMQDGMALNQTLRLRAVVRGPDGAIAKIQSGNDHIIVRDGDELDVNGIRYTVTVEADGLMLRGSGEPQYKMLVR